MSDVILKAENISKQYRLGVVSTGALSHDIKRWWFLARGKEDPFLNVGAINNRSSKVSSEYVWALKDINFEVKTGEVLGIIGKNGAGKSTLLKILSRVTSPTTGSIKTRGRIASLLEVGTGFHPELTGRENIYLNGAILGMSKAEINSKFEEIVDFSGCEMYIDTPTKRYSSGMTVRLAFAVAAHLEPEILVVDEVLAVGDAEFQKKAIGKMQDITQGEGRTVLFVSHNMASIKNLCTRSLILADGSTVFDGKVEEAVEYYLSMDEMNGDSNAVKTINNSDRKGNGLIKLDHVELLVEGVLKTPITGKPLEIKFVFDNPKNISSQEITFDFRIDDNMGQKLIWLSTSIQENIQNKELRTVSFHFESLPLNYGTYIVTTHLTYDKEVVDWAKQGFRFQVNEGFFYNSLKTVNKNQSNVLVNFNVDYHD
ncbi:MAG: ABC transporter ATP-binding protein [Cytophagaceae bacterium]|nr:ABC transporter ATP-binding protein [Cytophagaceae bacterium]|tara:strand:- start:1137 stop:2417 length:1281 start_codon:yes stop_codon:yes gene_type:complete